MLAVDQAIDAVGGLATGEEQRIARLPINGSGLTIALNCNVPLVKWALAMPISMPEANAWLSHGGRTGGHNDG